MITRISKTEGKILNCANEVFLLYGYHAATLQQIAIQAGVNKSAVHYYFRSKDRLYVIVVKKVLDNIFDTKVKIHTNQKKIEKPTWFLITELYNNKNLFEKTLKELYPNDWDKKLNDIIKLLKATQVLLSDNITPIKVST
jgi:TetR/AcrR family transcriptional regulator